MGGILAIVSHPDDETFGCGGTIALHGGESSVLCLTCNPRDRRGELEAACEILGIAKPIILIEDDVTPSRSLTRHIADVIVAEKPSVVITHLSFDYHADHRATHDLVKEAIEWAAHTTTYKKPHLVERLLLMEVNTLIPSPHVVVDITETMDKKKLAVKAYSTQLAKFPWDYYDKFVEKKARLRGVQGNCTYAEAFIDEPLSKNSPFYKAKTTKTLLRRK